MDWNFTEVDLASRRRILACKSSDCCFSASTVSTNQDASVAVTVPRRAIPPIINAKATIRPALVIGQRVGSALS
jgi:hypothetical protein